MPDDFDKLLKFIVHHYTGREEVKDMELEASSVEDVQAGQRRILRDEELRAEALAPAFRDGLLRADAARRAGGNAISLDDRDPLQNQMADALVHFLVSPGLASSSTRETEPRHYTYTIGVDWDHLRRVAAQARIDLDALLRTTNRSSNG